MADDIVTRLAEHPHYSEYDATDCLRCEAADEIRRLRRWKGEAIEVLVQWDSLCGRTLKAVRIGERKTDAMAAYIDAQEAEIERLRAALALAVGELSTHGQYAAWTPDQLKNQFLEKVRHG